MKRSNRDKVHAYASIERARAQAFLAFRVQLCYRCCMSDTPIPQDPKERLTWLLASTLQAAKEVQDEHGGGLPTRSAERRLATCVIALTGLVAAIAGVDPGTLFDEPKDPESPR